jgi:hypothetical protein
MRINATYNNYIPASTTKTVTSGAGKVHAIIFSTSAASALITIYDNTAGSGNILFAGYATQSTPLVILFDSLRPLIFSTGCTVVTPANSVAFVQTES